MRKRFGPRGIVGAVVFLLVGVNEAVALFGRANLLDRILSHAFGWQVTPTFNLMVMAFGLLLILTELRKVTTAATADDADTAIPTPNPIPDEAPIPSPRTSPLDTSTTDGEKELAILRMFVEFNGKHTSDDVRTRMHFASRHLAEYHLARLGDMDLICHSYNEYRNGLPVFIITRAGRDFLVRLNLIK